MFHYFKIIRLHPPHHYFKIIQIYLPQNLNHFSVFQIQFKILNQMEMLKETIINNKLNYLVIKTIPRLKILYLVDSMLRQLIINLLFSILIIKITKCPGVVKVKGIHSLGKVGLFLDKEISRKLYFHKNLKGQFLDKVQAFLQ